MLLSQFMVPVYIHTDQLDRHPVNMDDVSVNVTANTSVNTASNTVINTAVNTAVNTTDNTVNTSANTINTLINAINTTTKMSIDRSLTYKSYVFIFIIRDCYYIYNSYKNIYVISPG